MQYLYTQEEHDRIATDEVAFAKRVSAEVEVKLKEARVRTLKVIEDFFNAFKGELLNPYGASISFGSLQKFSDRLREANSPPKEKCDKDTGNVIQ